MLPETFMPAKRRVRRKHKPVGSQPPPPAALTLVAASYEPGVSVTLTFDRPVSVAGFDGTQVIVDDGVVQGVRYDGTGGPPEQPGAAVVFVIVNGIGDSTGEAIVLDAGAMTGIVAVDDGGTWAGVSGLVLPFP